MTETAQYLLDRLAIQDLLARYATAVDRRDLKLFRSCFTEDVVVQGFGPVDCCGLEAWMESVQATLRTYGATQHLIGNQIVEIEGDVARVRTELQASHELLSAPGTVHVLWATYHSVLVRTAEGWKIREHRLEPRIKRMLVL